MAENSGGEKHSFRELWTGRSKRTIAGTLAGVLVIAFAGWGIWLADKRSAFSAPWAKLQALPQSPEWDWWVALGFVLLALLGVAVLWKVPQWQVAQVKGLNHKERFDKRNEARKTMATILGGAALLTGGYFTWRNFDLAREGQITDRFTKAVEQLGATDASGAPKLEVRLGGIYSLEAIAKESKDLHWPIMEALCSYIRIVAPAVGEESIANPPSIAQKGSPGEPTSAQRSTPRADIQTVLSVLGRRDGSYEQPKQVLDLSMTNIRGADLRGAFLEKANLKWADLEGSNLFHADLDLAHLGWAHLRFADLSGAGLFKARLTKADLSGAHLDGADLSRADLGSAKNLTREQVNSAYGDADTKLPEGLCLPRNWDRVTASTPHACPAPK
jgi:hypothetical protein